MLNIDIAVFAHNEESKVGAMIAELSRQTIFSRPATAIRLSVLANGCTDGTVRTAKRFSDLFLGAHVLAVYDLAARGKSLTWNRFVHDLSRKDADFFVFCDSDIRLPDASTLESLLDFLISRPELVATSSLPVKDTNFDNLNLGFIAGLIAAGGGTTGHNRRTAICGQLYMMRAQTARQMYLPRGLPVEDGFVRHAIITRLFCADVDESLIDQPKDVIHVYESERSIRPLIRHQVRIVIGTAVNAALFSHLIELATRAGAASVAEELARAATDPKWIEGVLARRLPDPCFGWVPWGCLTGRIHTFLKSGKYSPKRGAIMLCGFCLDTVAFVIAQFKMFNGAGEGYW